MYSATTTPTEHRSPVTEQAPGDVKPSVETSTCVVENERPLTPNKDELDSNEKDKGKGLGQILFKLRWDSWIWVLNQIDLDLGTRQTKAHWWSVWSNAKICRPKTATPVPVTLTSSFNYCRISSTRWKQGFWGRRGTPCTTKISRFTESTRTNFR